MHRNSVALYGFRLWQSVTGMVTEANCRQTDTHASEEEAGQDPPDWSSRSGETVAKTVVAAA